MTKGQKTILVDQKARDQIYNDLQQNFLVEASAGSGKTSCLVKRMAALVKSGKFAVDQIAAITFTRKAAIELKERFQQEIEGELKKADSPEVKNLLAKAILDIEQGYIGTIHSFCARILRERPLEAGLDPTFKELDEIENILLMEQAWEEYLGGLMVKDYNLFRDLNALGIQIKDLKGCYKQVCQYPEVEVIHEKIDTPELQPALQALFSFAQEAKNYILKEEPKQGYDSVQQAILQIERLKQYQPYTQQDFYKIFLLELLFKNFRKPGDIVLKRWSSSEKAKEYRDLILPKLIKDHIEPALTVWYEYCHDPIFRFIKPAVNYYHQFREKNTVLNFQDLLLKTAILLRNNPEIRHYFQQKYRTLLVDEFQDTDPIQAEIIFYLTGEKLKEKDWKKLTPRKGSLFIVGDPQQSIYHFRRADIAVYNQVKKIIAKNGGKILTLNANFRSLHSLGKHINLLFQDLFASREDEFQVTYSPMQTTREDKKGFLSGVYQIILSDEKRKKNTITNDALAIASLIRDWVGQKIKIVRTDQEIREGMSQEVDYRDFMILLRYRSGMDIYSRVLSEYGIPVTVSGYASLNESQYLRELLKLLRLLKDPENQVLLIAVLRGIFFGFSDQELYHYKEAGGNFNFFAAIPGDLENDLQQKFYHTFRMLKTYSDLTLENLPVVALEKIILQSGLQPYLCGGINENEQGGELYFILEYLRKSEIKDFFTYDGMVDYLERVWQSEVEEEFSMGVAENAVRIMNLHKAKGLEAPIVFLAIPSSKSRRGPEYHIERLSEIPEGYFLAKKYHKYGNGRIIAQPQKWKKFCQIESSYQEAEETRLLYVAATRAKNALIISSTGLSGQDNKQNPWQYLLKNSTPEMVLAIPENNKASAEITKKYYSQEEYDKKILKIEQEKEKLSSLTYRESSASRSVEFSELPTHFIPTVGKGGRKWGNAVHEVLDYVVRKRAEDGAFLSEFIAYTLEKNNIAPSRKNELSEMVQRFRESDLYNRVKMAAQSFTEVPFNLKIEPADPFYQELAFRESGEGRAGETPIIMTGIIDLVFQEPEGWVIVDYKTDCPVNKRDYAKLRQLYQKQISVYKTIWHKISQETVKETLIYFITE